MKRLKLLPVQFELEHEIEYPGKMVNHLFFLEEGMASMTATFKDGSQVEVGVFGNDSVIGVPALMGSRRSLNRIYTQVAGHGYRCSIDTAAKEFASGGQFQALALRSLQVQWLEAAQSAGCNARHNFEQRLARWLLICADRAQSDTFKMSHMFLAIMLGVTRPTVSIAAGPLKEAGLIQYSRGVIKIIDKAGLEKKACECYRTVKDHIQRSFPPDGLISA